MHAGSNAHDLWIDLGLDAKGVPFRVVAEVNFYSAELADQRDENGHRLVVRNDCHQSRKVTTAAGVIEVKAPRINDKRINEAIDKRK